MSRSYFSFIYFLIVLLSFFGVDVSAQENELDKYNVVWTSQSKNSSESMPCGGGDVGLNVWVEKGELLFYMARSGTFDENNALLKLGRVRIKLSPNPFDGAVFRQELVLKDGHIKINGSNKNLSAEINIRVDVIDPVIYIDINASSEVTATATYESWRYQDRPSIGRANNANSYKWAPQGDVITYKDEINPGIDGVWFRHRNKHETVFDVAVKQQGLELVKDKMFNPLNDLSFGGVMEGTGMIFTGNTTGKYMDTDFKGWMIKSKSPSTSHAVDIVLHSGKSPGWWWSEEMMRKPTSARSNKEPHLAKSAEWWKDYWERSFIDINMDKPNEKSTAWQSGRNYQLFRYMLGCNSMGTYPTKFNGGLFTYDPSFTDTTLKFTPDFRNWGGGTHTAQNQRLVYWPMLKSGDFDMMRSQFKFYTQILRNAELRSEIYWGHKGACFTEQMENFGLPNPAEYGWNRPPTFDKGLEYNAWLEYEWDTVLEFCLMILEAERYAGEEYLNYDYIPFIESCITFFNEHYQYLAKQRGRKALDGDGHLILYPGSGAETYKMANNSTSTIAALKTVLERLIQLPDTLVNAEKKKSLDTMLRRIPPITFAEFQGHQTIAPAKSWERINNTEPTQLYPVFPWGIYGVGKPDLDIAINTYKYDTNVVKFRSYVGWKQDNIFAARLGLTKDAAELTTLKLKNSGRRFPAFWGPGYDWTPDHNWGGSGMIGLQEMLMQVDDKKIYLFPAWPKDWDVHFKLCAPYQTTVEAVVKNGKAEIIKVAPESRRKDIINMF